MSREIRESRWLKKLIIEDPQAGICEAFDRYGNQVKTICRNILRGCSPQDIEDAISQTFIALWTSIRNYSPERGVSIKSYVFGIARKTCLMMLRNMPQSEHLPIDENIACTTYTTEDIFLSREQEKILHKILDETEEPARSIFIMRYFYFEKVADIAAELELPKKKVENILLREKKKLKVRLQEGGIER